MEIIYFLFGQSIAEREIVVRRKYYLTGMLLFVCFSVLLSGCGDAENQRMESSDSGSSAKSVSQINDEKLLNLEQVQQVIESGPFELKERKAPDWLVYTDGVVVNDEQKPKPAVYDIEHDELGKEMLLIFVFDDYNTSDVGWPGDESSAGGIPISGKNVVLQVVSDQVSLADQDIDFDELGRMTMMQDELLKVMCEKAFGGKTVIYEGESQNLSAKLELKEYQTTDGRIVTSCSQGLVKIRLKNEDMQINDIQRISSEDSNADILYAKEDGTMEFIGYDGEYAVLAVDQMKSRYSLQIACSGGENEEIILTPVNS